MIVVYGHKYDECIAAASHVYIEREIRRVDLRPRADLARVYKRHRHAALPRERTLMCSTAQVV